VLNIRSWVKPVAGYVLAALGAVLAFTIWAVVYTYVWPGRAPPAVEQPTTTPVVVPPTENAPTEIGPAIVQRPSDTRLIMQGAATPDAVRATLG
jgi:hypothetical protein